MALKKSCKCFWLTEPLGQPKTVVVFVRCQFCTSESHWLALNIFCLSDGCKRLIKNILILFEFFILSKFSTGYSNVQAHSDSSNTFRIRLSKLKKNRYVWFEFVVEKLCTVRHSWCPRTVNHQKGCRKRVSFSYRLMTLK